MYVCIRAWSKSIKVCIPTATSLQTRGRGCKDGVAEANCFCQMKKLKFSRLLMIHRHLSELGFSISL